MPDADQDQGILFAPRFGMTYDLTGDQSFILRAGGGVFYDRYEGNIAFAQIVNPPRHSRRASPAAGCRTSIPSNALLAPSALNARRRSGEVPDHLQLQHRRPEEAAAEHDLRHGLRRLDPEPPAAPREL